MDYYDRGLACFITIIIAFGAFFLEVGLPWLLGRYDHHPYSALRVVHFDLREMPPKMSYLMDLVPRLHRVGVNGILIEYADMFPYEDSLINISSKLHYTKAEISDFLNHSHAHGIEIIPLVRTFGYMKHILDLEEFQHLREDPDDSRSICPSNPESMDLIKKMLAQVLALHNATYTKRIHIGRSKVFTMNQCPRCLEKKMSDTEILFDHMKEVASFIREQYNDTITPLVWENMIRNESPHDLHDWDLVDMIEIAIQDYTRLVGSVTAGPVWNTYETLNRIWVAGAFKGADGDDRLLPSMENRYENHKSWMWFFKRVLSSYKITGFISTGHSLCNDSESLCELLPVSIPSLILNSLQVSSTLKAPCDVVAEYLNIMKCYPKQQKLADLFKLEKIRHCQFKESRITFRTWELEQFREKIETLYKDVYSKYSYSTNGSISKDILIFDEIADEEFPVDYFDELYSKFSEIRRVLHKELRNYYHGDTAQKWMEKYVEPYARQLEDLKVIRDEDVNLPTD